MNQALERAVNIVQAQTRRIRRRLRKNRSRMVYLVQNDDGLHRHVYNKHDAVVLAAHHGAWIYEGRQNARWIKAGNLTGVKWNRRRVWYMPKSLPLE